MLMMPRAGSESSVEGEVRKGTSMVRGNFIAQVGVGGGG